MVDCVFSICCLTARLYVKKPCHNVNGRYRLKYTIRYRFNSMIRPASVEAWESHVSRWPHIFSKCDRWIDLSVIAVGWDPRTSMEADGVAPLERADMTLLPSIRRDKVTHASYAIGPTHDRCLHRGKLTWHIGLDSDGQRLRKSFVSWSWVC